MRTFLLAEPPKPDIDIDPGVDTSALPYGQIGAILLIVVVMAVAWNKAPRVLIVAIGMLALLAVGATR